MRHRDRRNGGHSLLRVELYVTYVLINEAPAARSRDPLELNENPVGSACSDQCGGPTAKTPRRNPQETSRMMSDTQMTPAECGPDAVTAALVARLGTVLPGAAVPLREGDPAPLGIHYCLAPEAPGPGLLAEDGLPQPDKATIRPPQGYTHTMWAGGEMRFHEPLRVGDRVERRFRLLAVGERAARSGMLAFGGIEHGFFVGDQRRVTDIQSYVFRMAGAQIAARGGAAPVPPDWMQLRRLVPDEVALFRFSALTYNPHRIHFDAPYTTGTEGFPGLVVHGPLMAALLLDACAGLVGAQAVAAIRFRAVSPAFVGEAMTIHAQRQGGSVALELRVAPDRCIMTAQADLRD